MALVLGTNCGFVTVAPTNSPNATATIADDRANAIKDTSPSDVIKIIEIGWWNNTASSQEANFEVGLYSDAGNDEPENRLFVDNTNAKGASGEKWHTVTVDWTISASTTYWIALQVDNTVSDTDLFFFGSGGAGRSRLNIASTLPSDWGTGSFNDVDGMYGIYALIETTSTGTNLQINISDVWKEVPAVQINIGDAWKSVVGMQLNIGDVWKEIF